MTNSRPPLILLELLHRLGWERKGGRQGAYQTWVDPHGTDADFLFAPLNTEASDYEYLYERALKLVFRRVGVRAEHLYKSLVLNLASALTTKRWSKETVADTGVIPWEEGQILLKAAEAQLIAASRATREKRARFRNSGHDISQAYMHKTLMGQTAIGSFIISAHTPTGPIFDTHIGRDGSEQRSFDEDSPTIITGRQVTETFERILTDVRTALDEYRKKQQLGPVKELVEIGLSYEFANGLVQFLRNGEAAVQIRRLDADSSQSVEREISFIPAEAPIMEKVVLQLKSQPPMEQVKLTGKITLLERSSGKDRHAIRVDVTGSDRLKAAQVLLSPEQYSKAMDAHAMDLDVTLSGDLVRRGNRFHLQNLTSMSIEPLKRSNSPIFGSNDLNTEE